MSRHDGGEIVAGRVIADSRKALTLHEANYPPVQYIPRKDVDFSQLEWTDHATYCPYKGDCSYYSIPAEGKKVSQCGVVVPGAVPCRRANQRTRRVLSRSRQ